MIEDKIDISIIMVDGAFRENFSSIPFWLDQTFPKDTYELIWVDYTSTIAPEVSQNPRVKSFTLDRQDEPQILACAYNKGIMEAQGNILVIPDADVTPDKDLLEVIYNELVQNHDDVLYILRLDQPQKYYEPEQTIEHLIATCSIKHTYNYGGCTALHKKWLVKMNGYEQLPIFAGYHYNGGDNYIRFKNLGLKMRWHPTKRVYHAWHPTPPTDKFVTAKQQEKFIQFRAATWDWLAYEGIDPSYNRDYSFQWPSDWPAIMTERGALRMNNEVNSPNEFKTKSGLYLGKFKRLIRRLSNN